MNHQNEETINYSQDDLVKRLYKAYYSQEEKKIFLAKNGPICQTCHKLKKQIIIAF